MDGRRSQATTLSLLPTFTASVTAGMIKAYMSGLGDADPLVRASAIDALEPFGPDQRAELVAPHLADPVRAVRLAAARSLREAIFAIFVRLSERDVPADGDLRELEAWIRIAVRHSSVVARHGRYRWEPAVAPLMEQVICHVALSANDLLFSDALHRIGQCSGRDCRWLWIDRTRNHTRRWCDMAVCGNRAKAHRHYQRRLALDAHLSEP